MVIPNFFIVGTPKAGTTSLYYYLEEHPEVYMSSTKETNYFSYEEIKSQGLFYNEEHIITIEQYLSQFDGVTTEKAIGEASVSYLFYPSVPEKIKAFNPAAKIIMILRNPVDRGFSHYLMDKRLGFVNTSYEEIVNTKGTNSKLGLYYQQYVSLGLYYEQVKRYLSVFGERQVKILYFEDVANNLQHVIKDLYSFLEVKEDYSFDTTKKHNTFENAKNPLIARLYAQKNLRSMLKFVMNDKVQTRVKRLFFSKDDKPSLSPQLKQALINIYKDDIYKTSGLLQKDLSAWLSTR